jgi:hypothetical protein
MDKNANTWWGRGCGGGTATKEGGHTVISFMFLTETIKYKIYRSKKNWTSSSIYQ